MYKAITMQHNSSTLVKQVPTFISLSSWISNLIISVQFILWKTQTKNGWFC